jgi:hypothetical protein
MDNIMENKSNFTIPNQNDFSNVLYFQKLGFALVKKKTDGEYWAMNELGIQTSNIYNPSKIGFEDYYGNDDVGVVRVESNGKYGLIGKGGFEITPCEYEFPIWFEKGKNYAIVVKNDRKGLIGNNGKEISKFYSLTQQDKSSIRSYKNSKHLFYFNENGLASIEEDGKYGIIKNTGKEIAPCIYDEYLILNHSEFQNVSISGKFGIMSSEGKILLPCEYDSKIYFQEFDVANIKKNGKFGLIDRNFIEIVPCLCDEPFKEWRYSNGLAYNEIDGDTVFFDEDWKRTSEHGYDNHFDGEWVNGFSEVRRNNKYGFVDEKGIEVVPCIYDVIWDFGRMGILKYAKVGRNGKSGYVDMKGVEIIPCVFDSDIFFNINEGLLAIAKKEGKCGVIDLKNKEIVPIIFDSIYFFDKKSSVSSEKEVFICYLYGKKFVFDHNGMEISSKLKSDSL